MTMTLVPENRDAVYYPYIHIRSRAWLNGTLLCFPHLTRLIPEGYPVADDPWLGAYSEPPEPDSKAPGRRNRALLQSIEFWQQEVMAAHDTLAEKVKRDVAELGLAERFSLEATEKAGFKADSFRISEDRLLNRHSGTPLSKVLNDNHLVWPVSPRENGIHPLLGEAIMATVAMTVAVHDGMDVVTPSGRVHDVLAARDPEQIYDAMIGGKRAGPPPKQELIDDLASLVVVGAFDVEQLTPEQIVKLRSDDAAVVAFFDEIAHMVARIPASENRKRRDEYLRDQAQTIVGKFEAQLNQSFLSQLWSRDAIPVGEGPAKELLQGILSGGATTTGTAVAAATVSWAAIVAGVIVGGLTYGATRALKLREQKKVDPMRWLNRIHHGGAPFSGRDYFEYRATKLLSPD